MSKISIILSGFFLILGLTMSACGGNPAAPEETNDFDFAGGGTGPITGSTSSSSGNSGGPSGNDPDIDTNGIFTLFADGQGADEGGFETIYNWNGDSGPSFTVFTTEDNGAQAAGGTSYFHATIGPDLWGGCGWFTGAGNTPDVTGYTSMHISLKASQAMTISVTAAGGTAVDVSSYGFTADGTWKNVQIPMSAFGSISGDPENLIALVFSQDPTGIPQNTDVYWDEIYFTK